MSLFNKILSEISDRLVLSKNNLKDIVLIIKNNTFIEIKEDEISLKAGVLYIKTSPTIKSIIILKKENIIKDLKQFGIKSIM